MDSTSSSVTAPENHSHSSPIDSVNNNTMQNGIVAPAGDSEETDEVENVNSSVGNRTSVNGGVALGSVGNVTSSSADRDRNVNNDVDAKPDPEDDKELEELAKLRCQSVATEVVAERYKRRCSDYPGFAFGSSIFSSNTMMKFSIIKNELHNIMNVQLKRVSISCLFCFFVLVLATVHKFSCYLFSVLLIQGLYNGVLASNDTGFERKTIF